MRVPDLVLILSAALVFVSLLGILVALAARNWKRLGRLCLGLAIYISLYALLLVGVSLSSPQQVYEMHQSRCFDDWCVSVERVQQRTAIGSARAKGVFYLVTLRVTSQAKRIRQRALDAAVSLIDEHGTRYDRSPQGQQALEASGQAGQPLNSWVEAGGSFTSTAVFDLPSSVTQPGLVIRHGAFPGLIIIGDSQSFLHKPAIVRLWGN